MIKILYNARVYTLDEKDPEGQSIAVDGSRVLAVGPQQEILSQFDGVGKQMERQDLGGKVVIPGLTDAHIHLQNYALSFKMVDCEVPSRQECLQRVAERARQTPEGEWILGHGWNQNEWEGGFGTAADLDAAAPQNPVFLTAKSMHAAWANTAALRLAGLNNNSPDPAGGRFGRDAGGNLDGILYEAAMGLLYKTIQDPSVNQVVQAIRTAQPVLWKVGLTGVHDYDQKLCFAALQILHQNQELKLRVIKGIPIEDLPQAAEVGLRSGFGDDFLRIGSVKAFSDGALGPQTAAMFQPYDQTVDSRGMLLMDGEELFERGRVAVENGLSLAVHAIGDRANHEILNGFSNLRRYERQQVYDQSGNTPRELRHRIEHVQLLHPDDVGRLSELGVIASMQPIHATSDMVAADRYWGKRAALSYAWRSQLDYGSVLAFGSDAPVESPNPFWGLHAAVTRRRADGSPGENGWYPEQRLTVYEALRAYTVGAAYAASQENQQGKIAPGYLADLLVLDTDPFTCPPEQLRDIRPLATMVGGEWVYQQ